LVAAVDEKLAADPNADAPTVAAGAVDAVVCRRRTTDDERIRRDITVAAVLVVVVAASIFDFSYSLTSDGDGTGYYSKLIMKLRKLLELASSLTTVGRFAFGRRVVVSSLFRFSLSSSLFTDEGEA
jgi:hypothetical protein